MTRNSSCGSTGLLRTMKPVSSIVRKLAALISPVKTIAGISSLTAARKAAIAYKPCIDPESM